jgi:hypothetical protein
VACLLDHQPRRLQPHLLDRLGRGLAGFRAKGAGELARRERGHFGQFLHRQRIGEMGLGKDHHLLDAVAAGREFEQFGMLRLAPARR